MRYDLIVSIRCDLIDMPSAWMTFKRFNNLGNNTLKHCNTLEKIQNRVEIKPIAQSSFQKWNFCNSCQKLSRSNYQSFLLLSNLVAFFILLQIFCPRLSLWTNFCLYLVLGFFKLQYFDLFYNFKISLKVLM